jgi:FkbM family methyltransferase
MTSSLLDLAIEADETWPRSPNIRMRLATLIATYAPHGRGAIPRFIGKYLGRNMKTAIRTASGAYLAVEPSSLDVYATISAAGGLWESRVLDACLSAIRQRDIFYDIGANVGFMSIEIASRYRGSVKVIAFEPILALARSVVRSAQLNGLDNIRVLPIMLGSTIGQGELFIPSHSIHASTVPRESGTSVFLCARTTLDELVMSGGLPPPSVIKIDVEGSELEVFRGAERVIAQYAPTIVFEADANMQRFGYSLKDIISVLSASVQYTFVGIGRHGVTHERISSSDWTSYTEFMAVPPTRQRAGD